MHCWRCLLLLGAILISACNPAGPIAAITTPTDMPVSQKLTIYAAASLTEAFQEIGAIFEAEHPGVAVIFNFAGSQQLVQQLALGAPADVFASADLQPIQAAVEAGVVSQDDIAALVKNHLAIIYPHENLASLRVIQDLAKPGVKLVLAANEVPAGKYALQFLDNASQDSSFSLDFKRRVLTNVVSYEENVRAVLSKVLLDEADAGIVYTSDIAGLKGDKIGTLEIPERLNVTASYFIAPLRSGAYADLAKSFIELVRSTEGQAILMKYGFIPIQ